MELIQRSHLLDLTRFRSAFDIGSTRPRESLHICYRLSSQRRPRKFATEDIAISAGDAISRMGYVPKPIM